MPKTFTLIAHRGYSGKFTENSQAAFEGAVSYGAGGIEMDVQKTRDKQFVIFHDAELGRMTKGRLPGSIGSYTFEELVTTSLDAQGTTIMGFEAFLQAMPPSLFLDIELKADTLDRSDCPALYELIVRYRLPGTYMVSSFNWDLLDYFKKRGAPVGMLISEKYRGMKVFTCMPRLFSLRPEYLNLSIRLLQGKNSFPVKLFIRLLSLLGCLFVFWTVNTPDELDLAAPYTGFIITNELELMQNLTGTAPVRY